MSEEGHVSRSYFVKTASAQSCRRFRLQLQSSNNNPQMQSSPAALVKQKHKAGLKSRELTQPNMLLKTKLQSMLCCMDCQFQARGCLIIFAYRLPFFLPFAPAGRAGPFGLLASATGSLPSMVLSRASSTLPAP